MSPHARTHLILGAGTVVFAILVLAIWIPLDTATGLIEKVRRQVTVGDAMAPTLAACIILAGGAMLVLFERRAPNQSGLTRHNILFLAVFLGILAIAIAAMRWSGPAAVALFGEGDYRALRDTAPWKWIGYLLGGTGLIAGLIIWIEGRITPRAILVGLLATIAMIAIYDMPFDDLLLPPNGDV